MDEWISAVATAIGAMFTAVAAVVAIVSVRELRADSRDRTRPRIVPSLERPPLDRDSRPHIDLVLTNVGPTPALGVDVRFVPDPLIIENDDREPESALALVERFSRTTAIFSPGVRTRSTYAIMGVRDPENASRVRNLEPLPNEFRIHLSYRDT